MLREGDVLEGRWKIDRLLLDDGIAAYFETHPVGPDAPEPAPMLLLRAFERETVRSTLRDWPLREARVDHSGAPERFYVGPDDRPVLVDVFDVVPAPPWFTLGRRMAARDALEGLLEAASLVEAHHKARWLCRTLHSQSFFRAGNERTLCLFPPACMERFDQPLKEVLGTPGYIPPEAWRPEKAAARMDVYALGAVAYAWLSGEHPFAEVDSVEEISRMGQVGALPDLSSRFDDVPPGAAELVRSCTAPHPMDRPRFASDVGRLARDVLTELARSGAEARRPAPARREAAPPEGEGRGKSRGTRIMPFTLGDIIDATEGGV